MMYSLLYTPNTIQYGTNMLPCHKNKSLKKHCTVQALPNQHRCNDVQAGTLEEKHVRRKKKEEGLQNL